MAGHSCGRTERRLRRLRHTLIAVFLISAALLFLDSRGIVTLPRFQSDNVSAKTPPEGSAQVHYIDVGQGDCSLIISDDGSTILIDCGEREYSGRVLRYLDGLGIDRLDYVLVTHPHSDHMGGMSDIISSDLDIGTFIMPLIPDEYIPTTSVYENMLEALEEKGCSVRSLSSETLSLGSGSLELIAPDYSGENLNNYSAIVRFVFGDRKFLFSGDAEKEIENQILLSGYQISADVYKVGHHGSSTSSGSFWVAAVSPDYCVIECGAGNSYGHPDGDTLRTLRMYTDEILRTDINGTVVFTTDGDTINYTAEK